MIFESALSSIIERRYISTGSKPMPSSVMLNITEMMSMVSVNTMVLFMGEVDLTTSVCVIESAEEEEKGGAG